MDDFAYHVVETARLLRREFDRRAAAHGVTRAQWRVLVRLVRSGEGARQVDLAEALDVEPITLCRMIDRLEQSGLVERRRDDEDRRAWRIHLTAKAHPLVAELRALADDFHEDALAGISAPDRKLALEVLSRVRDNLNGGGVGAAKKAS